LTKKKVEKPQRIVTKRQLSQWQRQKKRQRIILGLGIFIIVAVIVIVGVGWYIGQYQPLHQTVIRVNNTEFNMKYYVEMLKINSWNIPESSMPYLANSTIKSIEQNELIKQGVFKLGISVSDDEVKAELKSYDLPDKKIQRDLVRTKLLIDKLRDEHFEQQVPVSADQRHVMAMLLESEQQVAEVKARLENGESFTELAEELSLDYLSETNQGDFGWHHKDILNEMFDTTIVEHAFNSEVGVLSQPIYDEEINKAVGYWLIMVLDIDEDEEEAHVKAMLLGSEEEAQDVKVRLEAGEDFATLAKELSRLDGVEENEGDLGILIPGDISPAFDEFVFNPELKLEMLSEPLRDEAIITEGGYWLIKVVDKDEDRPIEDNDRDFLKAKALDEWVSSLWDDPENKIDDSYLDDVKKAWAIEQAMKG
jgi:parvulin-like peptidyl-prolyl isomerase